MVRPRLYLDTTVPSALFDPRTPERQAMTQEFWRERLPSYNPIVSTLVIEEVRNPPDASRRSELVAAISGFSIVDLNHEALDLANEYIDRGIFPARFDLDAQHAAVATVSGAQYLASWNYRHLVKVTRRREINLVNALRGYGAIEIASPVEL